MPVPALTALAAKLAVAGLATATTTAGFVIASSALQPVDATEDVTETLTAEPLDDLDAVRVEPDPHEPEPAVSTDVDDDADLDAADSTDLSTAATRTAEGAADAHGSRTAQDVREVIDDTPPDERGPGFGQEVAEAARGGEPGGGRGADGPPGRQRGRH